MVEWSRARSPLVPGFSILVPRPCFSSSFQAQGWEPVLVESYSSWKCIQSDPVPLTVSHYPILNVSFFDLSSSEFSHIWIFSCFVSVLIVAMRPILSSFSMWRPDRVCHKPFVFRSLRLGVCLFFAFLGWHTIWVFEKRSVRVWRPFELWRRVGTVEPTSVSQIIVCVSNLQSFQFPITPICHSHNTAPTLGLVLPFTPRRHVGEPSRFQ